MPDNVSIVINPTGTDGVLVTVPFLATSTSNASGITATWTLSRTSQDTRIVDSSALALLEPAVCGGVTYTTSAQAIEYDLDGAAIHSWEQQTLGFGTNSVGNVTLGVMATLDVDDGNDTDLFIIYSNEGVTQFHTAVGGIPSAIRWFSTHGSVSSVTTRGAGIFVDPAIPYWISQRRNHTSGSTVELVIQNANTGAFLGCSHCNTDSNTLISFVIGSYLVPVGGTIKYSFLALAFDAKATFPLLPGAFVLPSVPSVVVVDNTSDISVYFGTTFHDEGSHNSNTANSLAFGYRIERSEDFGNTWTVLEANLEVPLDNTPVSPYVDSTVVNAVTYQYRITGLLDTYESAPAESNVLTHGASVWHDTVDPATIDTNHDQVDSGYAHSVVLSLPEGTATKVRVYIHSSAGSDLAFRAALYDGIDNLLVYTGQVFLPASSSDEWFEMLIEPTEITAGSYRLAWGTEGGGSQVTYRYKDGSGQTSRAVVTFTAFPPDPYVTESSHYNGADAAGVFVAPLIEIPPGSMAITGAPIY